jgi:predicted MFS family arabinose efflux permease
VSNLGISISSFAYPLVVLEATGSPIRAGVVGTVLAGTAFVLRLPAGVLVDRWNRRAILLVCDGARAVNGAAFALVLALGHFFFAQVIVVAFFEAALGVLFGPAESAAVRRVVGPGQVRDAVARNQSRAAVPGVVGPPLGGALLAVARPMPFLADAVSYLVSLACIASVRTPLGGGGGEAGGGSFLVGLFAGLRWIWARPFLRALLLWMLGMGTVFSGMGLVILVIARDHGASSAALGAMFAITGVGGAVGALAAPAIVRRFRPVVVVSACGGLATAAAFGLLAVHSPYLLGALGAAAFILAPAVNAIAFGTIAEQATDAMQGRATSAAIQIAALGGPLGPVTAGVLLGAFGASTVVLAYGCVLGALALAATASKGLRASAMPGF